jgi:type VI secretion system secreted protein VgrG
MQAWAGAGRGIQTFPRIGDEVVIDFLGGDIDRPLVVGSLYSAANPPPYREMDHFTRTTIKSKTVPEDGDKHNEIRLDDKKGHEQVLIHASRDLDETIDHCHSTHVRVDQSNTVGGDQTETVHGNQTLTVDEDRTATVEGNETLKVTHDQKLTVDGTRHELVGTDRNVRITGVDTETFEGGRETTVFEYDNLHVSGADRNVTVDQQLNVNAAVHIAMAVGSTSKLYMKGEVYAEGADRVAAKSGDSQLLLNPQKAELASATEVRLVCGAASIVLKPGGEVEINAPAGIKLQAASNSIEIKPSGVTTSGVAITANAVGVHTIQGAIVRIN